MKKLLAITLITMGILIAGGYSTYTYAQDTQAYTTQDNKPTTFAWGGTEPNTVYHAECSGPWVATMTHTFKYEKPCIIVDIEDDHLNWTGYTNPGDYMIMWTNITASIAATGTSWFLHVSASQSNDIVRVNGTETINTYYALVNPGSIHPSPNDFRRAGDEFDGELPGAPVQSNNGYRAYYKKDLWARVTPTINTPAGKYEDVFYLTFQVNNDPNPIP